MSYQSLARKYRPATFDQLAGQESVAVALSNAIKLGREPHAVIFSGVRGIGKTTTARLYAKALDCENGPTPTPCNACASCEAISKGNHEDVIEIDGASNTGVDDVRALRETLGYVPQRSKFKVYIIDEVHMLSQSAFNALLKTLEEPPPHVVFIFATTELGKVPQTILSRCQTFYLQKLSLDVIADRIKSILVQEKVAFEENAVAVIAREGRGSLRDALTLLDQAVALGAGHVTLASLSSVISNLSSSPFLKLLDALVEKDAKAAYESIEALDQSGVEFDAAMEEMAKFARHAFVLRDLPARTLETSLLGLSDAEREHLVAIGQKASPFDLNRIFRTLYKCRLDLDGSGLDRFIVENYIFEWCLDPGLPDLSTLLETQGKNPEDNLIASTAEKPAVRPAPTALSNTPSAPSAATGDAQTLEQVVEAPRQASSKSLSGFLKNGLKNISQTPQAALVSDPIATEAPAAQETAFPSNWSELVERWKKLKPLHGRQLEEVYVLTYSAEVIRLAVKPDGMAGQALLQKESMQKLQKQFIELFGFAGALFIEPYRPSHKPEVVETVPANETEHPPSPKFETTSAPPADLQSDSEADLNQNNLIAQESILDVKRRDAAVRKEKLIEDAKNAPLTQAVLAMFGGAIKDVQLREK